MVRLDFTPVIDVLSVMFDISLSIFTITSIKQHLEYFNIKLDLNFCSQMITRRVDMVGPASVGTERKEATSTTAALVTAAKAAITEEADTGATIGKMTSLGLA